MGVGGTNGMDGADVERPGRRGQRRGEGQVRPDTTVTIGGVFYVTLGMGGRVRERTSCPTIAAENHSPLGGARARLLAWFIRRTPSRAL